MAPFVRSLLFAIPCVCMAVAAQGQSLSLDLGTLEGREWKAAGVKMSVVVGGSAQVRIAALEVGGRGFKDILLTCGRFSIDGGGLRCDQGLMEQPEKIGISFSYSPAQGVLSVQAVLGADEVWRLEQSGETINLNLANARLERIAPWLSGDTKPVAGRVNGVFSWSPAAASAQLVFEEAGFSDASGLHAGEKIAGRIDLSASRLAARWRWRARLDWSAGAVFWEPFYVADGGHALDAEGELRADALEVATARLDWRGVGRLDGALTMARPHNRIERWSVEGKDLKLGGLGALLPAEWLEQNGLPGLALSGTAAIDLAGGPSDLRRFRISLSGGGFEVKQRSIGLTGLDLAFAYDAAVATPFRIGFQRAHLRDLALGPVANEGEVRAGVLTIPNLVIPVQDGFLALNEIEIRRDGGEWGARLRGAFTPLSMQRLTTALEWHPMSGTISAVLPRMTYARSTFSVDGALLFKVFDGEASVDGIRVDNPFGRTPRLAANIKLRGLDLAAMTGAVKFGDITGKVDVDVRGLEMENWQPLSFDARILTSEGDFAKRISQRAVQNISSIGGAGAGAAIQASFLRFFNTFGYDRIGLSCKLVNGVCEMGGIDAGSAAAGFTIIKGGGVPSVNVVGYNRHVGWQEMLDRIRAVIDGNSKMIVQ